jgi:hypothetical protein
MVRKLNFILLVMLVGLAVSGVGCGQMATSPLTQTAAMTSQTQSAPLNVAPADGSSSPTPSASSSSGTALTPSLSLIGIVDALLVRTLSLIGSLGGTLTNGRWKVVVPPNAISGTATVSVGVTSTTSSACQLDIYPLSSNHFAVPVTLTVDCHAVPSDQLAGYTIFWYDPVANKWVPVEGAQVNLVDKTVSAPLAHFSRYAVGPADGKAGW